MLVPLRHRSPLHPIAPGDLVLFLRSARLMIVSPFIVDTAELQFHQRALFTRSAEIAPEPKHRRKRQPRAARSGRAKRAREQRASISTP